MPIAYLNGDYLPLDKASIPLEDRGFLFADGIYEVLRFYHGRPFRLQEHLERLNHSIEGTRLPRIPDLDQLAEIIEQVRTLNDLDDAEAYIGYTRGPEHPRSHPFPVQAHPTLFVMPLPVHPLSADTFERGVPAITHPDLRWARCDIKSIMLLPNVLAKQQARERGAHEAILVRDGIVTEGSTTNMFAVIDGILRTHPGNQRILGGISRLVTLELANEMGLAVQQEAFTVEEMFGCQELFLTSTTSEVLAITSVDGQTIANGVPGPITQQLLAGFRRATSGGV